MHLEPFLLRGGADEALEIAARVQPLPAPVGCSEERRLHLRKIGAALTVVRAVQLAREEGLPHVLAVPRELLLGERLGTADQLAGVGVFLAALTDPVLHRLHLHVLPVLAEAADDAAVARALAVGIVPAFPGADRGELRRLTRRRAPLVARVVRDAVHADLAAAPRLLSRPLDALVDVPRLARVVVREIAGRAAGAARIDAHAHVALRNPFLRIDRFPVLVAVRGAGERVGILARHDLPRGLVALLEREPLAVGAVAQDRRVFSLLWTKHVGAQHQAIVHADGHVPVDLHSSTRLEKGSTGTREF